MSRIRMVVSRMGILVGFIFYHTTCCRRTRRIESNVFVLACRQVHTPVTRTAVSHAVLYGTGLCDVNRDEVCPADILYSTYSTCMPYGMVLYPVHRFKWKYSKASFSRLLCHVLYSLHCLQHYGFHAALFSSVTDMIT